MRQWNAWGHEGEDFPATEQAQTYLREHLGPAQALPDATLQQALAAVPASRLQARQGWSIDPELRLRHARGQSLPDWLALRSGHLQHYPDAVAQPSSREEVRALLDAARQLQVTVIPYGGGTSVVGHINPLPGDRPVLTLSLQRMNRLLSLDPVAQIAHFGAGTPGPEVEAQLRQHGFLLGHFPQSYELSTVGGWVASRSSGQQSMRYGRIEQLFAGGHVETLSGSWDIPALPASSAGPDLREMLLGSEGRFGVITDVALRVSRLPEQERFHVAFVPDAARALACVRELVQQRTPLSMLRLSLPEETRAHLILAGHARAVAWLERYLRLRGIGAGKCMLTFGLTGSRAEVATLRARLHRVLAAHGGVDTGSMLGQRWQAVRFRSPYLRESLWRLGYAVDTLETAVDWSRLPQTVEAIETSLRQGLADEGERVLAFSHLSHMYGEGSSIYTTYFYRCADSYERTQARWQKLKKRASEAIVAHAATISHQHGVGIDHAPYLQAEKGVAGLRAIHALCQHFDPQGLLNPGKLLELDQDHQGA